MSLALVVPTTAQAFSLSAGFFLLLFLLLQTGVVFRAKEIMEPACIGSFYFFVGFVLILPFAALWVTSERVLPLLDGSLVPSLVVVLCAYVAYLLGTLVNASKAVPLKWVLQSRYPLGPMNLRRAEAITLFVACGCLFRYVFKLGAVEELPLIFMPGIFQYLFYDGAQLVALYVMLSMRRSIRWYFLALMLLLMISTTQALLGWRGGALRMVQLVFYTFLLQSQKTIYLNISGRYQWLKKRSIFWLIVPLLFIGLITNLGQSVREQKSGVAEELSFVRNVYRFSGLPRLTWVMQWCGNDLDWFNITHWQEMVQMGVNPARYVDYHVYGVGLTTLNAIGGSGPGVLFVMGGLVTVAGAFLVLGILAQTIYSSFRCQSGLAPGLYLYPVYVICIQTSITESFEFGTAKWLFALFFLTWTIGVLFSSSPHAVLPAATRKIMHRESRTLWTDPGVVFHKRLPK